MAYLVAGAHDPLLVALSVAVATLAAFSALDLAGRIRAAEGLTRWAWLATAALAMGGGIWSMHFVAMLAFSMSLPLSYDLPLTALSLALAILVTGAGFAVVGNSDAGAHPVRLGSGGLLMGIGIAVMHYTGMAAMRMPATLFYDPLLVALSVLIAIVASTAALWLASRDVNGKARAAAAGCMGLAISAMHYTGMGAVAFSGHGPLGHDMATSELPGHAALGQAGLALGIASATFLILSLALLASYFDRQVAASAEREAALLRESEERFRTLYRSTPLPLHVLDAEGCIFQVSDAWLDLLGLYPR